MPCEKIVLHIDLNMDIAQKLVEEFSSDAGGKPLLYPDPISCLVGNLGLETDVLSLGICYVDILNRKVNLAELIAKDIGCWIVRTQPVNFAGEILGLKVLCHVMEYELNSRFNSHDMANGFDFGPNAKKLFGRKLGLFP